MDFAAVILFLTLSYIRPHEWISLVSTLRLAALSLLFAIVATVMRERKFEPKDLFKTPHDWLMFLYFFWIVLASHSHIDAWKQIYAYLVYYWVTVQALSNLARIQKFLNWWSVMIVLVAGLAILSEHGVDPMGSSDITNGVMKGRLILNVSIFNNPNALGHSVVPVIVMLYFICIWKRPVFFRVFAVPVLAIPIYAIYLTLSKGAFLSLFVGILMVFTFGRNKTTQILMVVMACTVGWGAMRLLPRMNELDKTQKDGAIQGRVAAFRFGLESFNTLPRGLGFGHFQVEFEKVHHYSKASHSSFVEVGAEFGRIGFLLYLGIMYCALRTLVTCRTQTTEEERIRRILFCALVTFIVSSWMVDFAFRAAFFMMIGAVAAFHRHLLGLNRTAPVTTPKLPEPAKSQPVSMQPVKVPGRWQPLFGSVPVPAVAGGFFPMTASVPLQKSPTTITVEPVPTEMWQPGIRWNRVNLLDIFIVILWSLLWLRLWHYIISHV